MPAHQMESRQNAEKFYRERAPHPSEAMARQRYLVGGVESPDLATVKDFLRIHIATSRAKIVTQPNADFVNIFGEVVLRRLYADHRDVDRRYGEEWGVPREPSCNIHLDAPILTSLSRYERP